MAGKSSYLRQTALIVLMAQIGAYVPARQASIGLVDRIFTRVGASDNLAGGQSTFMVEMQEASYIIHTATKKSLIILDELGRGTSTYDGISISWAIVQYIHDRIGAKTIFATHYHELIELAEQLPYAQNYSISVKEEDGRVVFLRKVIQGAIDQSYGIEVARLAGLPDVIIKDAYAILKDLESKDPSRPVQKDLFDVPAVTVKITSETERRIQELDVDTLSPKEALDILYDLKKYISEKR
jgi:DNA mismatch repair protein MutS